MLSKIKNKKTTHLNNELVETLDIMNDFYSDLAIESKIGSEVAKNNMSTEFSDAIKKALENPLSSIYSTKKQVDSVMKEALNVVVLEFLSKHKSIIKKIFNPYPNNQLVYTIVLKKDTIANRAKIYEFNRRYEWTEYSKSFDIAFLFIPENLEDGLTGKEVVLN